MKDKKDILDSRWALEIKNYPNVGQSFGIVGIIILASIVVAPLLFVLNKFIDKEASTLIYYLLCFGVSFWIVYSIRKHKTGTKTFQFEIDSKRIIPFIIIASIALLFGVITPISGLIPMPEWLKKEFLDLATQNGVFSFMLMVIAAPIFEELIFRGIMLDGLLKKYSPAKSILISGFLFGLVHLNPWQFIAGLVLGIFMGWIYYKTKSLSLTIIIHAAVNLTGFLMRRFADFDSSSMDETLVESYGGVLNLVLAISVSILALGVCLYWLNNEFKKKETELPNNNEAVL